jgi:hypothetical protein
MMNLVEVKKPDDFAGRELQSDTVAHSQLAGSCPLFRRQRLQLCSVPPGVVLEITARSR